MERQQQIGGKAPVDGAGAMPTTVKRRSSLGRLRFARLPAALVVLTAFGAHGDIGAGLLLALLAASLTGLADGRVFVVAGLCCVVLIPFLFVADQNAWLARSPVVALYAARAGIYSLKGPEQGISALAFYLFGIGLAGQIVRYVVREKRL